jgi:hypothetical protein
LEHICGLGAREKYIADNQSCCPLFSMGGVIQLVPLTLRLFFCFLFEQHRKGAKRVNVEQATTTTTTTTTKIIFVFGNTKFMLTAALG